MDPRIYRVDISGVQYRLTSSHHVLAYGRAGRTPPACGARRGERMSRRSALLELAILGLLHESPLHGYELRKRLIAVLGAFRVLSYGTVYPCLRGLVTRGWIAEDSTAKS